MRCLPAALPLILAVPTLGGWIDDPEIRRAAMDRKPQPTRVFTLNLDLPPEQRWVSIFSDPLFKTFPADLHAYFDANVPKWSVPILWRIAADVRGHFQSYGQEMEGIARALGAPIGEIVLVNLVYALEDLAAGGCEAKNTTGPCKEERKGPGLCTSAVVEAADGSMWHGRNMDWNLPENLLKYAFDYEAVRGGKVVFRGSTLAGLVGALHGMRPGSFSVSMDARSGGGSPFLNILKFISGDFRSASHLLREALETQPDFDSGMNHLANTTVVEPIYYIVGGAGPKQGAVIERNRRPPAVDLWYINGTKAPAPWFVLQTNYDRTEKIPKWDDRQTPGIAHLRTLGQAAVGEESMRTVFHTWPTYNFHTDITAVLGVTSGSYYNVVWVSGAAAGGEAASDRAGAEMWV